MASTSVCSQAASVLCNQFPNPAHISNPLDVPPPQILLPRRDFRSTHHGAGQDTDLVALSLRSGQHDAPIRRLGPDGAAQALEVGSGAGGCQMLVSNRKDAIVSLPSTQRISGMTMHSVWPPVMKRAVGTEEVNGRCRVSPVLAELRV